MGYKEDNEREVGEMTLERLRMRQRVDAEYRKTVEQQAETRAIVAALKEEELRLTNALPTHSLPPSFPVTTKKKKPSLLRSIVFSAIVSVVIGAFWGLLCYVQIQRYDPSHKQYRAEYPLQAAVVVCLICFPICLCVDIIEANSKGT